MTLEYKPTQKGNTPTQKGNTYPIQFQTLNA